MDPFRQQLSAAAASMRRESGIAVRVPRILRWREDKRPANADRLQALQVLAR